ncbi:MAG TPA: 23S rRNA (uracil(1939)-C(5))-methyltransferase RlmD [Burkholderiaceae bacterium]|nr:23S rRNA (uracil(1939)-C(5))-methyltransferase RlmD [Burkholderiaceae bacterium]
MSCVVEIESLDLKGQGVAHQDGKVVFVDGALPGEKVEIDITRRKKSFDRATVRRILRESPLRVRPACPHFGVCGGCVMQHLEPSAQVAIKQRVLEDNLQHLGNVTPEQILAPLHGPAWNYRYRARLSVRLVPKKGGILVGFRERQSSYVADMTQCHVLHRRVSDLLVPLRRLVESLSCPDRIPQIEVAVGDDVVALVLRHLEPLTSADHEILAQFGAANGVSWWLQPKGPDSVYPLIDGDHERLYYTLPEFGLTMTYRPTDFTQVNHAMNRSLVSRALRLLDPQAGDRVADMFCGLGNFTLPLATVARQAVGIEGSEVLTGRAMDIARRHGLDDRVSFSTLNLFDVDDVWLRSLGYFDRMLIDPPREGALELAKALSALEAAERPRRIVYVSCNPATLARDAGILVHVGGYRLRSAGVANMFAHTGHVESIAVFE